MKTDHPIYLFLSAGPEAFRVLTGGHELAGPYRFSSRTLKGVERRLDGLFEPEGHAGPVYVVEFQGQRADKAWYNFAACPPGRRSASMPPRSRNSMPGSTGSSMPPAWRG